MNQQETLKLYEEALDRLVAGRPINVAKDIKITNDAVSLEAGRGKGSIKKSRPGYADLIARIAEAAAVKSKPKNEAAERVRRMASKVQALEEKLEAALSREMSLVYELFEVKAELVKLTGGRVVPIRRDKAGAEGQTF